MLTRSLTYYWNLDKFVVNTTASGRYDHDELPQQQQQQNQTTNGHHGNANHDDGQASRGFPFLIANCYFYLNNDNDDAPPTGLSRGID